MRLQAVHLKVCGQVLIGIPYEVLQGQTGRKHSKAGVSCPPCPPVSYPVPFLCGLAFDSF